MPEFCEKLEAEGIDSETGMRFMGNDAEQYAEVLRMFVQESEEKKEKLERFLNEENWKDYTYFGDMSYRNFGTDAQKITGYGIMNNGYMAVFKESSHSLEPNLYIRRSEITADSDGNYIESFPVSLSGISVGSDEIGQVINYGNDLLINAPKGIYKINTSESTATQTYEALEMSYYIRDNLNTDITGSCSIIFNGKLYITRKDYKGDLRVYVADQDRYSYIDNVRVYEWWVLDGINATKFYIFDNTTDCLFLKGVNILFKESI